MGSSSAPAVVRGAWHIFCTVLLLDTMVAAGPKQWQRFRVGVRAEGLLVYAFQGLFTNSNGHPCPAYALLQTQVPPAQRQPLRTARHLGQQGLWIVRGQQQRAPLHLASSMVVAVAVAAAVAAAAAVAVAVVVAAVWAHPLPASRGPRHLRASCSPGRRLAA